MDGAPIFVTREEFLIIVNIKHAQLVTFSHTKCVLYIYIYMRIFIIDKVSINFYNQRERETVMYASFVVSYPSFKARILYPGRELSCFLTTFKDVFERGT